jgi:hypothetical protein
MNEKETDYYWQFINTNLREALRICSYQRLSRENGAAKRRSFPTPLSDISEFEKNDLSVSVKVYGIEKKYQPPRKYVRNVPTTQGRPQKCSSGGGGKKIV